MDTVEAQTIETMRQLTLQVMLISAGVFVIVGGFVSASEKTFVHTCALGTALLLFSISTLAGYFLHGVIISMLNSDKFEAFNSMLISIAIIQIGAFVLGGFAFIIFVVSNVGK